MECANKECGQYESGICPNKCNDRINLTHTPNYAEEQLEHAKEKENRCYNKECKGNAKNGYCMASDEYFKCPIRDTEQPAPINYKEEYHKLKKENSDYEARLKNQGIRIKTDGNQIQKLFGEIDGLKKENEELKTDNSNSHATIIELHEEIDQVMKERDNCKEIAESQNKRIEELEEEINNLNNIIERKDKELDGERKGNSYLENENKKLLKRVEKVNKSNEELITNAIETDREIAELKRQHENQRLNIKSEMSENRELKAKVVELEEKIKGKEIYERNLNTIIDRKDKELENLKATIENEQIANKIIDDETKELKEQIKRLEKSTNENYYNWIETQKKNEKLIYKNSKLSEKVEVLKEGNIKLLKLL